MSADRTLEGWSIINEEEIFDSREEGLDENTVLLISHAPGVDFSVKSETGYAGSPTTDTNIIPPPRRNSIDSAHSHPRPLPQPPMQNTPNTNLSTLGHSRNASMENFVRPAGPESDILSPTSVYGAEHSYSIHSRNVSTESELSRAIPMKAMEMP